MPEENHLSAQDFLGKQTLTPTEEKRLFNAVNEANIDIIYERVAVKIERGRFAGLSDTIERATYPVSFLETLFQEVATETGETYRPSTSYLDQRIGTISKELTQIESTGILKFAFQVDGRGNLIISNGESTWTLIADRV
jgi:hypothetical protein